MQTSVTNTTTSDCPYCNHTATSLFLVALESSLMAYQCFHQHTDPSQCCDNTTSAANAILSYHHASL